MRERAAGRFGVKAEDAETCLAIVLSMLGGRVRGVLRNSILDRVTEPEVGDDYRVALEVLNTYERAFDELDRRRES